MYVHVAYYIGMRITKVRKNLHPHKKVRQFDLRNTRPEITQMIRLENQTPYPNEYEI